MIVVCDSGSERVNDDYQRTRIECVSLTGNSPRLSSQRLNVARARAHKSGCITMQVASPALLARSMLQSDRRNPLTFALGAAVCETHTCVCTAGLHPTNDEAPTSARAQSLVFLRARPRTDVKLKRSLAQSKSLLRKRRVSRLPLLPPPL